MSSKRQSKAKRKGNAGEVLKHFLDLPARFKNTQSDTWEQRKHYAAILDITKEALNERRESDSVFTNTETPAQLVSLLP